MFYSYRKSHSRSHSPSFTAIRSRATRADVFTTVMQEICNYCPMNNIILGGFSHDLPGTGTSLGEMLTFRSRLR